MFTNPTLEFTKPNINDEMYIGIVVDNEDPEELGRCRIRIREIHGTDEVPDDKLPWAGMLAGPGLGAGEEISGFCVPRVDARLVVIHPRGDIYSPFYWAEPKNGMSKITELLEDYPETYGWKDSDENYLLVNMEQDLLKGVFNGDVDILVNGKGTIHFTEDLEIHTDTKMTLKADEEMYLISPIVDVDADTSVHIATATFTMEATLLTQIETLAFNLEATTVVNITTLTTNLTSTLAVLITTLSFDIV
jgi:hypothetical protein